MPMFVDNYYLIFLAVFVRFVSVTLMSIGALYFIKKTILFIKKDANTRMFIGI